MIIWAGVPNQFKKEAGKGIADPEDYIAKAITGVSEYDSWSDAKREYIFMRIVEWWDTCTNKTFKGLQARVYSVLRTSRILHGH